MKTETISGGLLAMAAAVFTASTASAGPASYHPGCPAPPRKVETTSGLVKGHPAEGAESVSEFLGIPYAQPPVDELRWRPPVPYTGKSTINGTDYGFACWQPSSGSISPEAVEQLGIPESASLVLGGLRTTREQSEDCLTLNVWSKFQYDRKKKKKNQKKKAVLVWVHGGSFETGSSSIASYSGKNIAEQEDVVVVSLNYRLNIFGFPGNPVTEPNLGLLDLRLALEWVRDNIENFQGDKSRITVFGQSAGGALIDTYAYGWASDPIASGFIPMSGVAGGFDAPDAERSAETWFNISEDAGCAGNGDDPDAVSECMTSKSAAEILDAVSSQDGGAGLDFGPQPDGVRVFDDYSDRASAEGGYLIGNTNNENGLFRIYSPNAPDAYWTAFDLSAFICPAADRASRSAAEGRPTWRYWYFGDFPNIAISTTPPSGAWHAAELPVLFDTAPEGLVRNTEAQIEIGSYFRGAWAAFARDPQKGLLEYEDGWPAYDPEAETLVRLAFNNQTGANLAAIDQYDALCASLADLVPAATD